VSRVKVAVPAFGNLVPPRLDCLSLALDHSSVVDRSSYPFAIPVTTLSMTPPRVPVPDSVTFEFENGVKLTTSINPQTKKHSVTCDCCGFTVDLAISAFGENIHRHRGSAPCKKGAFKLEKERAKM
jgi:hypothetical protein